MFQIRFINPTSLFSISVQSKLFMIDNQKKLLIFRILSLNVILPAALFTFLNPRMPTVLALIYSSIPPLVDTLLYLLLENTFDAFNLMILLATAIGITVTFISNDPKLLLIKESLVTLVFAFGFLLSLFTPTPLILHYYRLLKNLDLDHPHQSTLYKHTFVITAVFGSGYLIEGIVRLILIFTISVEIMVYVSIFAPFVFTLAMLLWCWWYTRNLWKVLLEEEIVDISVAACRLSRTIP
jgi:hypothetical protein